MPDNGIIKVDQNKIINIHEVKNSEEKVQRMRISWAWSRMNTSEQSRQGKENSGDRLIVVNGVQLFIDCSVPTYETLLVRVRPVEDTAGDLVFVKGADRSDYTDASDANTGRYPIRAKNSGGHHAEGFLLINEKEYGVIAERQQRNLSQVDVAGLDVDIAIVELIPMPNGELQGPKLELQAPTE
jgi:hypothetical protein